MLVEIKNLNDQLGNKERQYQECFNQLTIVQNELESYKQEALQANDRNVTLEDEHHKVTEASHQLTTTLKAYQSEVEE